MAVIAVSDDFGNSGDDDKIEDKRQVLIRLGRKRFGACEAATLRVLNGIDSLEVLQRLVEVVFEAMSWQDLLSTNQ